MGILGNVNLDIGNSFEKFGGLIQQIKTVITGKVPPEEKAEIEKQLVAIENEANKLQLQVNLAEATHRSVFVAGARPMMMWICNAGIAIHFILNPLLTWLVSLFGIEASIPTIDIDTLMPLVVSMLGISGLRSFDKLKGTSK